MGVAVNNSGHLAPRLRYPQTKTPTEKPGPNRSTYPSAASTNKRQRKEMVARRNVLHGASAWEREEKANQQRDYAAQLQEQVLQKQAKQEQDKARKQREQREELDMLERERAAASRKHHPQQEQATPDPPPPAQSPQRTDVVRHVPVVDPQHPGTQLTSPTKAITAGIGAEAAATDVVYDNSIFTPSSCGGSEAYTPTFSSAPSIFESVFREPGIGARSIAFYEDLAALHRLTAELDSSAKQRHAKAQSTYIKPSFIYQEETSTPVLSLGSPDRTDTNKASHDNNQLEKHPAVPQQRIESNVDGLDGESVLLPLGTAIPLARFSQSKAILKSPTNYPALQFAADEDGALDNHSEMMRFTNSQEPA